MSRIAMFLAAFALPATPAVAMPIDPIRPPASGDRAVPVVQVTEPSSDELDWGSAGIGAATTAGLVLITAGGVAAVHRARRVEERP